MPAARRRSSICSRVHDPLAHVEDAHEFKRALGDRVTVIVIDNASHAAIEEQPEAISRALIDFANRLWPR